MSFILDALKKAESERSRNAGPVLMDVRIAPPRERLPAWAWILGGMLLATLLMLTWLLLRKPQSAPPVAAIPSQAAMVQTSAPATPAAPSPAAPIEPAPVPAPASMPTPTSAPSPSPAPAVIPPQPPAPAPVRPALPRIDNLPTAPDLVAQGIALPPLVLNLHVYDDVPANRYVLLNARRLREGDEVADGVLVETIVPRGVVFNVRGRRFVLLAGG